MKKLQVNLSEREGQHGFVFSIVTDKGDFLSSNFIDAHNAIEAANVVNKAVFGRTLPGKSKKAK